MASMIWNAALLAHEGGWDEILLVGAPILLIIGLLAIAKRRVDAQVAEHDARDDQHVDSHVEQRDEA
jgi:hypothetical protein